MGSILEKVLTLFTQAKIECCQIWFDTVHVLSPATKHVYWEHRIVLCAAWKQRPILSSTRRERATGSIMSSIKSTRRIKSSPEAFYRLYRFVAVGLVNLLWKTDPSWENYSIYAKQLELSLSNEPVSVNVLPLLQPKLFCIKWYHFKQTEAENKGDIFIFFIAINRFV